MSTLITFELRPDEPVTMTIDDARSVIRRAMDAIKAAPRIKCPTCRCHILVEEKCVCCAYRDWDEDEEDPSMLSTGGMSITIKDKEYQLAASLGDSRAFINYEGLFVLVDKDAGGTWDLSGQPASPEEEVILKKLTELMNDTTLVTVTKNE